MKKMFIVLLACAVLSGCASVSTNLYENKAGYQATNPQDVKVFHKMPQDRPYVELGEVTVSRVTMWSWAESELKKKAAALGGDAVYIINEGGTSQGGMAGRYGGFNTTITVTGVVIKYKDTAK